MNFNNLSEFKHPFLLEKANMYIVHIITNKFVETFEIISYQSLLNRQ